MERLNEILHELGISKVKLSKFLGVSRQMIYNYLEFEDINQWPKDKKVLLFNLLGIKSAEDIYNIKVDTDYILDVEAKINTVVEETEQRDLYNSMNDEKKDILNNIVSIIKEDLDDDRDGDILHAYKYLYNYLQTMETAKELKYILAYMAKSAGFEKPLNFVFDEEDQKLFESIMFSAMSLYNNRGKSISKEKLDESHRRFVEQIDHKREEKMSRTLELNTIKVQALKELNYDKITDENASEVLSKIAEIESRKVS